MVHRREPLVGHDLESLTSFVNEQIEFHSQLAAQAKGIGEDRKALRHHTIMGRYQQLIDVLEDCKSRALQVSIEGEGGWSAYGRNQWQAMLDAAIRGLE